MHQKLTAGQMLDRDFLEIRRRLLDIAAAFDRIERADAPDSVRADPRIATLREAAHMAVDERGDRARRVQMVFSDEYDKTWRGTST